MPKSFLRRYLPKNTHELDRDGSLRSVVGRRIFAPNVWHLNRRSVSGGAAIGVFLAWIPMPFQMIPAAVLAIWLRLNLPVAVVSVWISNPLTWAPMYWFAYRVGLVLLGREPRQVSFEPTMSFFFDEMLRIWPSLLTGCLLLGVISAGAAYGLTRLIWRWHVIADVVERRRQRKARARRPRNPEP